MRSMLALFAVLAAFSGPASVAPGPADDLLIADFDGSDYGNWKVEGTAFGTAPARGALPGQMNVDGFRGKGFVNSFVGGDAAAGRLTSPPFTIDRAYIAFLIGGGRNPGQTCMNLLVDGRPVRTASGPNDKPGGSERLELGGWDVRDLRGKMAVIEIVDRATGGWGHINVDHIVQTDAKPDLVEDKTREIRLSQRYLLVPIKSGAPKVKLFVLIGGKLVRDYDVELAPDAPDFTAALDMKEFAGATLTLRAEGLKASSRALDGVTQAAQRPDTPPAYREPARPQFHFTARQGWLNDPNGLVYANGLYHLFFQHNPVGTEWGNMHWGHAVSRDLVHWEERDVALAPDALGTMFSGSAVIDTENTAGLQSGREKTIALLYTAAGGTSSLSEGKPFTQGLAYSVDGGKTWQKYAGNPVLPHIVGGNRDPKVVWHAPTRRWIMALYLDGSDFALFSSPDLKTWEKLQTLTMPGSDECPDFFEMAVEGKPGVRRWVFTAANGRYLVGSFDGRRFTPETGPHPADSGPNFYAVQTYSHAPDGRRIQIAWMRGTTFPGAQFGQQMSFPCDLSLRETPDGLRLYRWPAKEIRTLYAGENRWTDRPLRPGENPMGNLSGRLWDIEAEFEVGQAEELGLMVSDAPVTWRKRDSTLNFGDRSVSLVPENGRLRLRLLADVASLEIFGNGGQIAITSRFEPKGGPTLGVFARGGTGTKIVSLTAHPLRTALK